jgi:hypothetical protein
VFSHRNLLAEFRRLPGNVVLLAPKGPITDRTPLFRWRHAPGATSYRLQVVTNPGGVIVLSRSLTQTAVGCADHVSPCRYTTPAADRLALGSYRWRVRGRNAVGFGPFSPYQNFSVTAPAPGLAAAD